MRRCLTVLLAGLVAIGVAAPAASALDAGLAGQWHFDQVDGTGASSTTADSSGNGQTGLFTGTPTLSTGRFASALDLSSNFRWMQVNAPGSGAWPLEPASQKVSVTVWFKRSGWPGFLKYLVAKGDLGQPGQCPGSSYAFYTGYNQPDHYGLNFYVTQANGVGVNSPNLPPSSSVWDGNWHVATGTYDGATVRMFVDGAEVGSGTPAPSGGLEYRRANQTTTAFTVGTYADRSIGQGCGNSDFPGAIDEVRIHDHALSVADVQQLHAPSATTPPDLGPLSGPPDPGPPGPVPGPVAGTPSAVFSAVTAARKKPGGTLLDASLSADASGFKWDFNGNGKTDLVTAASEPYLLVRSPGSLATNVKLTTFNTAGASSTSSNRLTLGSGVSPSAAAKYGLPTVVATSTKAIQFSGALDPNAIRNQICLPTTVIFMLVEAKGCMVRTGKLDDVPAAELGLVRSHYGNEIFDKTVNAICNSIGKLNGNGKITTQKDCDDAREFFKGRLSDGGLDAYFSKTSVKFNGLTITPKSGASVVIYPSQQRIISSNAKLTWGDFTIQTGQIDLNVANSTVKVTGGKPKDFLPEGQANLLYFDAGKSVPEIAGFKLNGTVQLYLTGVNGVRSSVADLHVQLPAFFNVFGGNPPTGDVRLTADNNGGPVLDNLDLKVPETNLGAVYLRDVRFAYALRGHIDNDYDEGTACDRKEWKAQAKIFISGTPQTGDTGFILAPPPSQNGVGFCAGDFKHAGGKIVFGGAIPKPEVFPGVFLTHVGFAMQLDPTLLRGEAGLSVADFTKVDGAMFMVFATPGQPYRLAAKDAGAEFAQLEGSLLTGTTIAVGGDVTVPVPALGDLTLGDGAAMYTYPDFVAFGGHVRVVVPGMSITGGMNGWAQARARRFQLAASVDACVAGIPKFACAGAQGMVGSRGMSACFTLGPLHPGGGYIWGDTWPTVWPVDGCKPSRFWEKASAAQASGERTFTVAKGEDVKQLKIPGVDGAPKIKITAPDGEVLTIGDTAETWVQTKHMVALRQDEGKVTWAGVKDGAPGTYKIEPLDGSVAMQPIAETRAGYSSDWKATVSGSGTSRVLRYDVGKPMGQSVTFVERIGDAAHILGTATNGTGTIKFTPAPEGGAGKRTIQAVATIDGTPIQDQDVATFTVSKEPTVGRPLTVRVKRVGKSAVVTWATVRGAKAYSVTLKSANGPSRTVRLGGNARSRKFANVALDYAGVVSVTAADALKHWGKPRTTRFARRTAPVTALQTNARNEKRQLARR